MPIEIGLLPTQQDSFEHHEELSKLLHETDVFYVPVRSELTDANLNNNNPELHDLTKRFDEDLSNRHLIVTFRDIGYSLFLDSVQSLPDETDRSKVRVSGKMIVDGICIQFIGCFDYGHRTQQINGVGRIELDENYYRELSLTHISEEVTMKDEGPSVVQPVIVSRTRQPTARLKERTVSATTASKKHMTRSRAFSENTPAKQQTSPPPASASAHSSRSHQHSLGHMPYPLRSPRNTGNITKQQSRTSLSPVAPTAPDPPSAMPSFFNEYPLTNSAIPTGPSSTDPTSTSRFSNLSHSSQFSSSTSIPIPIPTTSTPGLPTSSLPHLTNMMSMPQSGSLPTYFFQPASFAYIGAAPTPGNPSGTSIDLSALTANGGMLLFASPGQHPSQPMQILAPIDFRSLQFTPYPSNSFFLPPPPPTRISNILPTPSSIAELAAAVPTKRYENDQDQPFVSPPMESNKQLEEQLPFKKRRFAGQTSRMATVHDDDDEVSDESVKK